MNSRRLADGLSRYERRKRWSIGNRKCDIFQTFRNRQLPAAECFDSIDCNRSATPHLALPTSCTASHTVSLGSIRSSSSFGYSLEGTTRDSFVAPWLLYECHRRPSAEHTRFESRLVTTSVGGASLSTVVCQLPATLARRGPSLQPGALGSIRLDEAATEDCEDVTTLVRHAFPLPQGLYCALSMVVMRFSRTFDSV